MVDSPLYELAPVLVRLDHVASRIINANHSAGLNVSPAVRDYFGTHADRRDRLAIYRGVPPRPWRSYCPLSRITGSPREVPAER